MCSPEASPSAQPGGAPEELCPRVYRTLFDSIDHGLCILDVEFDASGEATDYRFVDVNRVFERQIGLRNVRGRSMRSIAPDQGEFWLETYGRVAKTGEALRFEHRADALGKRFAVNAFRVETPDGPRVAALFEDITERIRGEGLLRASEQRFKHMADSAPALLWITDRDDQCIILSRGWYEFTGQTEGGGLGEGWLEAIHPEDREETKQVFLRAAERREEFSRDFRLRGADGEYRWALDRGRPRLDEAGRYLGFVGSVIDMHERKLVEAHLAEKTAQLEEDDRRKVLFIATLGHEIRNPLASLDGAIRVAQRGEGDLAELLPMMASNVQHLATLVDDLLDVSRVTRGKVTLRRQALDLVPLLDACVDTVRSLAASKDLTLTLALPDHLWIEADEVRLLQVFSNLLSNAVRFTPNAGEVGLELTRDDDQVVVEVRDTGCGIETHRLDCIFEPFVQDRPGEGGLGVGLALARGLVALHGGHLSAESAGRGRGSVFTVRLPIGRIEADDPGDRASGDAGAATEGPGPEGEPESSADLDLRILVVDDVRNSADLLARLLQGDGAEVRCAYSGEEGLAVARRWRPHVMLLDLGLPDLSGYEVASALRAEDPPELLLAVTGFGDPATEAKVRESCFDGRLVKPLDYDQLLERLRAFRAGSQGRSPADGDGR